MGFIHRGIKPKCILKLKRRMATSCCLEPAKVVAVSARQHTQYGTPACMSPEVTPGTYTNSVDVYSAALIVCEMVLQKCPSVAHMASGR